MNRFAFLMIYLLLITTTGFSQTDISIKIGATPWHINHDFDDLTKPYSLSYTTGLNIEQAIPNSGIAFQTGIEYTYSQPGTNYIDRTDNENLLAVLYQQSINERYINRTHHEFVVPLMFVLYANDMRIGLGGSYRRYQFGDFDFSGILNAEEDYGLNASVGARFSKRVAFSIGYYYGLKPFVNLTVLPDSGVEGPQLNGTMQQISVSLSFSLFNKLTHNRYYLSPLPVQ